MIAAVDPAVVRSTPGTGVSSSSESATTSTNWITSIVASTPMRRVLTAANASAMPKPSADPRP
jgi:hypothetical protein